MIDDALSAVDAHVGKHIFDECITKELLTSRGSARKRSVILATNALQHLNHPRVDKIVVLKDGRIVEQGSYRDLSEDKSSEFARFLSVIDETGVKPSNIDEFAMQPEDLPGNIDENSIRSRSGRSVRITLDESSKSVHDLMTVEDRSIGRVGSDV